MSAERNVELVKQAYAAFGTGNIEALLSLFAEDIEWAVPEVEGSPFGSRYNGREEVRSFFATLVGAEEFREFVQDDFIAQGDKVVVTGRSRSVVRSTGRTLDLSYVHTFTVGGGKIQRFVEYLDTAAVQRAFTAKASGA